MVFIIALVICFIGLLFFNRLSSSQKYFLSWLNGLLINLAIISIGMILVFTNDIRQKNNWISNKYQAGQTLMATITEQPVEKPKSFKAEAEINYLISKDSMENVNGKIIIYFRKDTTASKVSFGDRIVFNQNLQEIKNSGNPSAFDFKRYSLFNGITHQVYLTENDFKILNEKNISSFHKFLHKTKTYILEVLKKYIPGKKEQGLAEALLIGYKDDLDKNLLQSYTNTGVVHIIAVSGMHLALLFLILDFIFKPLLRRHRTKWLHPVLVISILWLFTLLTGGAASIVRAAVMFTFIMIGKSMNREPAIYNILAASAFCLLLYNPFWLWDVGFQLSYAAVLSIVIFYKPIYGLVYIKNKLLDWLWSLVAVSIAAQILTTPLSIYHFHQFPVYFLITNLFAVPVSSLILIGELILVFISPIKILAAFFGEILYGVIWWLNTFIERLEQFPFALWDGLQINIAQTILLFVFIAAFSFWLFEKLKTAFWIAMFTLLFFVGIRAFSFYEAAHQQKIIVYNVPKYKAIDFINGRDYYFVGDNELLKDDFMRNFHIKPSRILHRISPVSQLQGLEKIGKWFVFNNKKIILIDSSYSAIGTLTPQNVDLAILSGNPRLYIADLLKHIIPAKIVVDGSAPAWRARYWKHDCDSFHIPYYDVTEKGAFVMKLH